MKEFGNIIISCLVFLLPIAALFAPHSLSVIFILLSLYPTYFYLKEKQWQGIWYSSYINKVLIILLAYSLVSTIWAIKPSSSLNLWIRMLLFFIGTNALVYYAKTQCINKDLVFKSLIISLIISIILANIEIFTNGFISMHFKKPLNTDYIVGLNRGSSILSIISWPIILYLFGKGRYKEAALLYVAILTTIVRLESLSSVMGLIAGLIISIIVKFGQRKALNIMAAIAVIAVFIIAAGAKIMDAHQLVNKLPVIPGGASNMRLYIWDYAAEQAYKKPILGWGFNASRDYPVKKEDYVDHGRSPLPLHPHNNVLQIWLELGIVGLFIFAAFLAAIILNIRKESGNSLNLICYTGLLIILLLENLVMDFGKTGG